MFGTMLALCMSTYLWEIRNACLDPGPAIHSYHTEPKTSLSKDNVIQRAQPKDVSQKSFLLSKRHLLELA
jgi:hypothetical protein